MVARAVLVLQGENFLHVRAVNGMLRFRCVTIADEILRRGSLLSQRSYAGANLHDIGSGSTAIFWSAGGIGIEVADSFTYYIHCIFLLGLAWRKGMPRVVGRLL